MLKERKWSPSTVAPRLKPTTSPVLSSMQRSTSKNGASLEQLATAGAASSAWAHARAPTLESKPILRTFIRASPSPEQRPVQPRLPSNTNGCARDRASRDVTKKSGESGRSRHPSEQTHASSRRSAIDRVLVKLLFLACDVHELQIVFIERGARTSR